MNASADVIVVGAGMAGASVAAEVAAHASVILLEAESQPGYHSTGRSAAFLSETYGGPLIQPLTTASRAFLDDPPKDFSEESFLRRRGALHIADSGGEAALEALSRQFSDGKVELQPCYRWELTRAVPGLSDGWNYGLWEPTCADIDVARLHSTYLSRARARGARLVTDARLVGAEGDWRWRVQTTAGTFEADMLVNAAGAWADEVARLAGERPLGIQPYRRTIVQLRVEPPAPPSLPLVIDALGRFYFKPEPGGRLWLSPHDETPCEPCDCAPEEYDVALAIDRLERAVDWKAERVEHSWAGLRSFAPDRLPVYGYAPGDRRFFWFAGQGGFGIQTAPAAAKLAAASLLGREADPLVAGIDPAPYGPGRFTEAG